MARPLSLQAQEALESGQLVAATLLNFNCRSGALNAWNWPGKLIFEGVEYESLYERLKITKALKTSASLASEPLPIEIDASRAKDDNDFVGRFIDADYHQAPIRVRTALLNLSTDPISVYDTVWDYSGRMDSRPIEHRPGEKHIIKLMVEGGLFRVRGRRMHLRTDVDQQRRAPDDTFFAWTPIKLQESPYWGVEKQNLPGESAGKTQYHPRWPRSVQ